MARTLLVVPIAILIGVIAFLGVKSSRSSVKVTSASADSRFSVNANAAAAQYGTLTGTGATPSTTTTAATTTTNSGSTHGSGSTPTSGTGTGTPALGTSGTPRTGTSGKSTPASSVAGSEPVSGAEACSSTAAAYSTQTLQGYDFSSDSGDVNLYGDSENVADGVSGVADLAADVLQSDPYSGSEEVFGDSTAVGNTGIEWNTGADLGQYVPFCKFWPVDPWGRWGFELYCSQSTPCHGTAAAQANDPAEDNKLVTVTGSTTYTVAPYKLALVDLTLNTLGGQLLTQNNGELAGVLNAQTVKSSEQPTVLSGERDFQIYYVRCIVWGGVKPTSDSLEAQYPESTIGKAYKTLGLSHLAPNLTGAEATGNCSTPA